MALRTKIILLVCMASLAVVIVTVATVYNLYLSGFQTLVADRKKPRYDAWAPSLSSPCSSGLLLWKRSTRACWITAS